MLKRLFQLTLSQILKIKSSLQLREERPWGFKELFLSLELLFLEAILSLLKFNILLFKKPTESYIILTQPVPDKLYEYSFLSHKKYSKRISVFSLAGFATIIASVVIVSLVLNILTQPALQSLGATFSWTQTSWSSGWQSSWETDYPADPANRDSWGKYSTSTNVYLANSGADLQMATTTLSNVQTTAADFNNGTYVSNTQESSNSVILTSSAGGWSKTSNPNSGAGDEAASSIAVDSTGVYIAGSDKNGQWRIEKRDLATGDLIASFGTNGVVIENPVPNYNDQILAIAIDSTGIYIGGFDQTNSYDYTEDCGTIYEETQWRIEKRDLTTGALISGFGTNGIITDFGVATDQGTAHVNSIIVNGSSIFITGLAHLGRMSGGVCSVSLLDIVVQKRDTTTGAVVANFGTNGRVNYGISTGAGSAISSSALYSFGKYDQDNNDIWVITKRDLTTGNLISDFGSNGVATETLSNYAIPKSIIANSSGIYLSGSIGMGNTDYSRLEKRDLTTGALISGFGTNGVVEISMSNNVTIHTLVVDETGIYAGSRYSYFQISGGWRIEKRDLTTGDLISDFGTNGVLLLSSSGVYDDANGLAIYSSNLYVAGGVYNYIHTQDGYWRIEKRDRTSGSLDLVYNTPGNYTSGVIDIGFSNQGWGSLSWSNSTGQTIEIKVRSCDDNACSSSGSVNESVVKAWDSVCTSITSGQPLSSGSCVTNGDRYIQYQALLSTTNPSVSPSLDDVTLGYIGYATSATLTSSFYNTADPSSVFAQIIWTEDASLPAGTEIKFQVRSAPNSSGAPGTPTSWMGPAGNSGTYFTNSTSTCEKSDVTVTCTFANDLGVRSGGDDQWIQYKLFMVSDGANTPTVSQTILKYAINVSPQFQNINASQNSDGSVTVNFQVRDTDTDAEGNVQNGYVILSLQYFDGSAWQDAVTTAGHTGLKAVNSTSTSEYTGYSINWTPATDFNGQATTTMLVRVKANDQEAANALAYGTSSPFTLDTKDPISSSATFDARTNTLALSASDDNSFQMMISNNSDYSADGANNDSGSWITYSASRSWTPPSADPKTIYIKYKDAYDNVTETSVLAPQTPTSAFVQDISLASSNAYRVFFSWGVVASTTPAFSNYYVERSISSTSDFANIYTISDRLINYYVDSGVTASTTYFYRVYQKNAADSYSNYSTVISAIPNGTSDGGEGPSGSNDTTAPTISGITVTATTDTTATITWTTNELSDSYVRYDITGTSYLNKQGVVSMVTAHEVTLVGLTPSKTYRFIVESRDVTGNVGSDASATNIFTTSATQPASAGGGGGGGCVMDTIPPSISDIKVLDIKFDQATISWKTNEDADSLVELGTTQKYGLSGGTRDASKEHKITILDLSPGTIYHFKVTSADNSGNIARSSDNTFQTKEVDLTDKEQQNAFNEFEKTILAMDTTEANKKLDQLMQKVSGSFPVPVIIGEKPKIEVSASQATISWKTDRQANSIVALARIEQYDPQAQEPYNLIVGKADEMTIEHIVNIPNLYPATTYHFQLRSKGVLGEIGKSKDFMFTTTSELPEILKFLQKKITQTTATIYWLTNVPTDSLVEYTPWRNGQANFKETKTQGKPDLVLEHEITLAGLEADVTYTIKISGRDANSNQVSKILPPFTTTIDKDIPIISVVKTESAIQQGFKDKIQTIISWKTDEPATTQIVYQEGLGNDPALEKSTALEKDLTTSHAVVITSFKPATVYSFRIKSADEAGNEAVSKDFTILTPQKAQSVIQIIINNFENTFGWFKKLQL